jgi:hypothetical protein
MSSKTFLCGFASPDLFLSKYRYLQQASSLNFYKKIFFYGPRDLSLAIQEKIKTCLLSGDRKIYGFGIWKPQIIYKSLLLIPEGSILQYSDVGCHFNANGLDKLKFYQDFCDKKDILVFQYKKPSNNQKKLKYLEYLEYEYSKSDLLDYFNLSIDDPIVTSPQIWSGTFFIKKNKRTIQFINKWAATFDDMRLVDNSPSFLPEHKDFVSNRWDQSTFSILCKLENIFSLSVYDHCEWALDNNGRNWSHLKDTPIHAKRDLKYISIRAFFKNINKKIKRKFLNEKK